MANCTASAIRRPVKLCLPFAAFLLLEACSLMPARPARAPQRCRNLIRNANWERQGEGWRLPAFAKLEQPPSSGGVASIVVEGAADGAIAQIIPRPPELSGLGVVAVGYARVELSHTLDSTDDDITSRLWEGSVNLVNGYSRNGEDFASPYVRIRFTGREIASGCWKRFVTGVIPAGRARLLYPHFAFWGARLAPGVKLHLAALSLVEAPADDNGEPERWVDCANLPAPSPVLAAPTQQQWAESLAPNGSFDSFHMQTRPLAAAHSLRELVLEARYHQGSLIADRYLISVTQDGSDPRLSPTSHIVTALARRGVEDFEAVVKVRADAQPLRIAIAGAAEVKDGLRAQPAILPLEWQRPRL
ncbi:MAG TPA: hypothetical protein VFA54_10820 [Bryobacterales bacterium]|nr:hypothetical protein [Bryobacterales bacterium]